MDTQTPSPAAFLPGTCTVPKRKVGRPKGSKGRVMQEARALGVHHFAFVRSSLLGLDLGEAFNRYLAWAETTTDLRHVQHRRDALLKHIIEAGRQHDGRCCINRIGAQFSSLS